MSRGIGQPARTLVAMRLRQRGRRCHARRRGDGVERRSEVKGPVRAVGEQCRIRLCEVVAEPNSATSSLAGRHPVCGLGPSVDPL